MKKRPFFLGALVGALIAALLAAVLLPPPPPPGPPDPERMLQMLTERFTRDLSLSREQAESIKPVIMQLHTRMLELKLAQDAEAERFMTEADGRMMQFLSQGQRRKLLALRAHFQEERERAEAFLKKHREESAR
jgi:hypothetical protein